LSQEKKAGARVRSKNSSRSYFTIIHQDADIIVADKRAGVLTVPIPGKQSRNLQDMLSKFLLKQKREALIVHRIDRYTSGLVVFAKHRRAREKLVAQFRAHTPERIYLALARGNFKDDSGTLRHNLELTRDGFRQRVVKEEGTPAVTHYKVLERFKGATLLEVQLDTGLKNQIRVQFGAAGHPLVGDRHYSASEAGAKLLDRQALHAWKLSFIHPVKNERVTFEAPIPNDFGYAIKKLKRATKSSTDKS